MLSPLPKNISKLFPVTTIVSLTIVLTGIPSFALSQVMGETSATSTLATTTLKTIPEATSTTEMTIDATSTGELAIPLSGEFVLEEDDNSAAVLGATTDIVQSVTSPPKPLKERKFTKTVRLDRKASHKCDLEAFQVDISNRTTASDRIILQNDKKQNQEEIEIGSLPLGIDIIFSQNKDYLYQPKTDETELDLEITSEPGSQKGNFSIPIIYTQKSVHNSIVICQINIINQ